MTDEQREALVRAVDFLDAAAGDGIGYDIKGTGYLFADEVIYDLFNAFLPGWDGKGEYGDAARANLPNTSLTRLEPK